MKRTTSISFLVIIFLLSFSFEAFSQAGVLDSSFGGDGVVTTDVSDDLSGDPEVITAVSIQPDGKVVVAGYAYPSLVIARYTTDGLLDNSFGNLGIVKIDSPSLAYDAYAMALQTDGKIVIGGSFYDYEMLLARFNSNGTPDSTFSSDGFVFTNTSPSWERISAIVIQPDGKITGAGYSVGPDYNNDDLAILRWDSAGNPDSTFNDDGKVIIDIDDNSIDFAQALAVQSDGKYIVAGGMETIDGNEWDFILGRGLSNGNFDNSFGDNGLVKLSLFDHEQFNSVALQPDGKIVAAGFALIGASKDFAIFRFNNDGTLDSSFSGDGMVFTDVTSDDDFGESVLLQPDGKLIVTGYSYSSGYSNILLTRYNDDGTPDSSFGVNGFVITNLGTAGNKCQAAALQPDGKIVAGAYYFNGTDWDFAVLRYLNDLTTGWGIANHSELPEFVLYPNPLLSNAVLKYELLHSSNTVLTLTDICGRNVRTFFNEMKSAGSHEEQLSFEGIAAGIYELHIKSDEGMAAIKLIRQ